MSFFTKTIILILIIFLIIYLIDDTIYLSLKKYIINFLKTKEYKKAPEIVKNNKTSEIVKIVNNNKVDDLFFSIQNNRLNEVEDSLIPTIINLDN